VLIINNYFSLIGGAEVIAYDTFKLLKRKGHEVFFFALDRKPYIEDNYEYSKFFIEDNFHLKGAIKHPLSVFYNKGAIFKLQNFIDMIKPDVVQLHNVLGFSPLIFRACKDVPTILTVHQADIICPMGTLKCQSKIVCSNVCCKNLNYLPCIFNNYSNITRILPLSLLTFLYNKNLKYVDKFITPSIALKNAILKSNIGIKEDDITVINNFIPNMSEEAVLNPSTGKYFLYVGRLVKEKDVMTLLKAFKDLPKDIELHIAGSGLEENNLKAYVIKNNLANVKFLGFLNREDVKKELKNCIASILSSNCFEAFGVTNVESFIAGKPVIASNIGGIPEIVEHNINGLLFEPTNVEQLKKCILTYWHNPELAVEHGQNGYQKALRNYAEDLYYENLINLYEKTIDKYKNRY